MKKTCFSSKKKAPYNPMPNHRRLVKRTSWASVPNGNVARDHRELPVVIYLVRLGEAKKPDVLKFVIPVMAMGT